MRDPQCWPTFTLRWSPEGGTRVGYVERNPKGGEAVVHCPPRLFREAWGRGGVREGTLGGQAAKGAKERGSSKYPTSDHPKGC